VIESLPDLLVIAAAAFVAPFALGLVPAPRIPAVVLEIALGIAVGPSVLGWAEPTDAVNLFALVGIGFVMLIAGFELDFDALRGRLLELSGAGFAVSFALALVAGFALRQSGVVDSALLVAIALAATSLGVVVPTLKDAGELDTRFGALVLAAASVADALTVVLLSVFFSEQSSGLGAQLVLLVSFLLLVAALGLALFGSEHSRRLSGVLLRLQDTTAQIRVRGAFLLLLVYVVLANRFGIEAILGAFLAGATIKLIDRDRMMTHPAFREKLEAVGFGVFIPFFFVASGVRLDVEALFASGSALAKVPLFLVILLAVRGLPAILYVGLVGARRSIAAGLLQATSLGFLVVVSMLALDLGLLSGENAAAIVAAGLLSVLLFPPAALSLLRQTDERPVMEPA
jgi:Kef-type K+ transport system membrane component KefB